MAMLKQFVARLRALFRGGDLDRDFAEEMSAHLEMADRGEHSPRHGAGRGQAAGGAATRRRHVPAVTASRRPRVPVPRRSRPGSAFRIAVDDQGPLVVGRGDCRHRARDRRQHRRLHHRQRGVPARLPVRRGGSAARHFVAAGGRLQAPGVSVRSRRLARAVAIVLRHRRLHLRRDQHQRRTCRAGADAGRLGDSQPFRCPETAARPRPHLRGRRRTARRRAGRDHRLRDLEASLRSRSADHRPHPSCQRPAVDHHRRDAGANEIPGQRRIRIVAAVHSHRRADGARSAPAERVRPAGSRCQRHSGGNGI